MRSRDCTLLRKAVLRQENVAELDAIPWGNVVSNSSYFMFLPGKEARKRELKKVCGINIPQLPIMPHCVVLEIEVVGP